MYESIHSLYNMNLSIADYIYNFMPILQVENPNQLMSCNKTYKICIMHSSSGHHLLSSTEIKHALPDPKLRETPPKKQEKQATRTQQNFSQKENYVHRKGTAWSAWVVSFFNRAMRDAERISHCETF